MGPAAFMESYDRLAPVLLALAQRIIGARDDAERVVEEAFLEAWRSGFTDPPRLCLEVRRRALSIRFASGEPMPLDADRPSTNEKRLPETLSLQERVVLELSYFEGLRADEIAGRVARNVSVVREYLRTGVAKLSAVKREGAAS